MSYREIQSWVLAVLSISSFQAGVFGSDPQPPSINEVRVTNAQKRIQWTPYPGAQQFKLLRSDNLVGPYTEDSSGRVSGYEWASPVGGSNGFYRLEVVPLERNALLTAIVLNRLAYGPTPDELERVMTSPSGPDGYIQEQLAPELIAENLPVDNPQVDWVYVTLSGKGSGTNLYIYPDSAGDLFIDDIKLVAGTVAEAGPSLIRNGDFEAALTGPWTVSTNLSGSTISSDQKHAGNGSLHLISTKAGSSPLSVWQSTITPLNRNQTYTLSYWYLPSANGNNLTIRLSSNGILSTHSIRPSPYVNLANGTATIEDLRAWYVQHAVQSRRQLLEVMTQFVDNHFTTYYSKTRDYMDNQVTNDTAVARIATELEYREVKKWREVLTNPNGTFYDLLKASAESPAMIAYLDTVSSSGNGSSTPNENYSRELMELFTLGVDNGYDQTDIEQMARAWTGWRVGLLPPGQENDPFATANTNRYKDNLPGYWNFYFRPERHDPRAKTIFAGKRVDARFGPPYAGIPYQLNLPARAGTDGIKDGYDVLNHLVDLPYTREFICVKLCRTFVHENFMHGVYDYTDPNLSPEAKLIRDCMAAWDTTGLDGRTGNIRNILRTIFNSALFREHTASQQKVKTPFEFVVSSIRALRALDPGFGFTANTDGYDLLPPMTRMNMRLFDREEPDGWSEFGRDWVSTSSLVERTRFVQNLLSSPENPLKDLDYGSGGDDNLSDPIALIQLKLAPGQWRDASAVANYFLGILFPGEGDANLDLDRSAAIAYLDSNDTGAPNSSPFPSLTPGTSEYESRVRGMVALLMSLPRFQEQ